MKKATTKVFTVLLLLIKTFDCVNAQSSTKGVSCHQTVTNEIVHDITCTDFLPDRQKYTISSCTLCLYALPLGTIQVLRQQRGGQMLMFADKVGEWGWPNADVSKK